MPVNGHLKVYTAMSDGWNHGSGRQEASYYSDATDRTPAAGWNVCSRDKFERGFFEPVCIFDGDIFIDGLPYRTNELEYNGDSFADSIDLNLFQGDWELRIAFDNFTWEGPEGSEIPIAFPAVRGQVAEA